MSERDGGATRAAIFGLGRIGAGFGTSATGDPLCHADSYARLADVEIVLGVDPDADARARFAARFPRAAVLSPETATREAPRIDVASIASATDAHADGVQTAIALGARVLLVEKPIAADVHAARALADRCRAAGVALIVNYSRRWTPMLAAMRAAVAPGGRLGPPRGASLRYTGARVHNGTHWIDLLLALLGPRVEIATDTPDLLALRFAGCTATLTAMAGVPWSGGEGELWSDAGMLRFADGGQRVTFAPRAPSVWPGFEALGSAVPLVADGDGLRGHLLGAVAEAVAIARGGGAPSCSGDDGLRALAIAQGRVVS